MRLRVALAVAVLLVAGALALDMSGRAPRTAGTDHVNPSAFVAALPDGQELCQGQMFLPEATQHIRVLVGSYGHPLPGLAARFLASRNRQVAAGRLASGAHEGWVSLPINYRHGPAVKGVLCIRAIGQPTKLVLAGEAFAAGPASVHIGATPQPGRLDVIYMRPGRESWWELLPTLVRRFGVGKASFFGDWTLPVAALLLLGVWVGAIRLLLRELA